MSSALQPICTKETPCKCCGAPASLYGLVDFNKNCEIYRKNALEISGVPIYYHRCPECRFIFTTALDHFSQEDFERYVYNDQYPLIDPDYSGGAPEAQRHPGDSIAFRGQARAYSRLRRRQRQAGRALSAKRDFSDVKTYDPFVPRFAEKPDRPLRLRDLLRGARAFHRSVSNSGRHHRDA